MPRRDYQRECLNSYDPTYVPELDDPWYPHVPFQKEVPHDGLQVREAPALPWCGPSALAAALGISYPQAEKAIKVANLRQYLKAVTYSEMRAALQLLGVSFTQEDPRGFTVKEYMERKDAALTRLICVPVHWFVLRGNHWACSQNPVGRPMKNCPYLNSRVLHVVTLTDSAQASRGLVRSSLP